MPVAIADVNRDPRSENFVPAEIVPADIIIDAKIVSTLLQEQFALCVEKISLLGEGWDNSVFLVNGDLVFRFPRRKEAAGLVEKEMRVLPLLKDRLTLSIPDPIYFGKPTPAYESAFYGHQLIKGQSGCSVRLSKNEYERAAIDLGLFLRGLHDIGDLPPLATNVEPSFDRTDFEKYYQTFVERLRTVEQWYDLTAHQNKFEEICNDAQKYRPVSTKKVLIHGDFYHRHLIFNESMRVSGVIDWGDSSIADPVGDLGIIYQFLPQSARKYFFETYGDVDDNALHYARFIGLYLAVALLWFGYDRKDQDLIRTSLWTFAEI